MAKFIFIALKKPFYESNLISINKVYNDFGIINLLVLYENKFEIDQKIWIGSIVNPKTSEAKRLKIYELSNKTNIDEVFPDKLKDLKKYSFKLFLRNQPPNIIHANGKLYGPDTELIILMAQHHNAKFHVEVFLNDFIDEISEEVYWKSDFTVNTDAFLKYGGGLKPVINYKQNGFCVLAPISGRKSPFLLLVTPFDILTWLFIFCAVLISSFIWNFILRKKLTRSNVETKYYLFSIFGLFFGQSLPMLKLCVLQTFIFQLFVFLTFILGNIYQSVIISLMSAAKEGASIKSFEELKASNLQILVDRIFLDIIQFSDYEESFLKRLHKFDTEFISDELEKYYDQGYALIMDCNSAYLLLESFVSDDNSLFYRFIPEQLYSTFESHIISGFSPFYDKFRMCVMRVFESGLRKYWIINEPGYSVRLIDNEMKNIVKSNNLYTLEDFSFVFLLLVCGLSIAFIAFIGEILMHYYVQKIEN